MRYILRPMEPGDVPAVAAIDRLSFPTPWPASAFQQELRREQSYYHVLVRPEDRVPLGSGSAWGRLLQQLFDPAKERGIVGYVGFRLRAGEGHITTIAVHPDFRRRGLGELLLLIALDKMVKLEVYAVTLEMRPSNGVAYHLYRKYGFEVQRRQPGYYRDGEDAWVMVANVENPTYRWQLAERWRVLRERLQSAQVEFERDNMG